MTISLFKRPRANSLQTPAKAPKYGEKEPLRYSYYPHPSPSPNHVYQQRPEDQTRLHPSRRSTIADHSLSTRDRQHQMDSHNSRRPPPPPPQRHPSQERRRHSSTVRRPSTHEIMIHPLIRYTPHVATGHPSCPLVWDLRQHPGTIKSINNPALSSIELSQHATSPPVSLVRITCGIFPPSRPIHAQSSQGVSILDIVDAIYRAAQQGISAASWDPMSSRQKDRIARVFHERCRASPNPLAEKNRGVKISDCLGGYTRFAGLEIVPSPDGQGVSCVLTLDRVRDPRMMVSTV